MTNTTPGPWIVETFARIDGREVTQVSAFSEDGNRVLCCEVLSFNTKEDSRLIAAAPDLLMALQEIVDAADGTGWAQLDATFTKARAAIARAKGEKS